MYCILHETVHRAWPGRHLPMGSRLAATAYYASSRAELGAGTGTGMGMGMDGNGEEKPERSGDGQHTIYSSSSSSSSSTSPPPPRCSIFFNSFSLMAKNEGTAFIWM